MMLALLSACNRAVRWLLIPAVLLVFLWLVEPAGLALAASSPAADPTLLFASAPLQRTLSPFSFVALLILLAFLVSLFYGFLRWLALTATAGRRVQRPVRKPRCEQDKMTG